MGWTALDEKTKSIVRQEVGALYYGCATLMCVLLPGSSCMWKLVTILLTFDLVYEMRLDGDLVKPGWKIATLLVALGTAFVAALLVAPVILDGSIFSNFDFLDPLGN